MKKILTILLLLALCLSFSACKKDTDDTSSTTVSVSECSEQDIRMLMERNLDCYYLFYVSPLSQGGGTDSDGYTKANTSFFADYNEMCDFVRSTYTAEKSSYLLNSYPSTENPLYIQKDGAIYVDLDAITPIEYNVMWDDSYTVEITEATNSECKFTLKTTDFDEKEYVAEGTAVFEDGKWLFTDLVY